MSWTQVRFSLCGRRCTGIHAAGGMLFCVLAATFAPVLAASPIVVPTPQATARATDYMTAFDRTFGRGVTPRNNAAVPLLILNRPDSLQLYSQQFNGKTWHRQAVPHGESRLCKAMGISQSQLTGPIYGDSVGFFSMLRNGLKDGTAPHTGKVARVPYYISGRFMQQPWKYKPNPWIVIWLRKNATAFTILLAASKRTQFFVPLIPRRPGGRYGPSMLGNIFSPLGGVQTMGEDLEAMAMVELGHRHVRRCMRDLLAVERLANLITQEHIPISILISESLTNLVFQGMRTLAASGQGTARQLRRFLRKIASLRAPVSIADVENTTQRWMSLAFIQWAVRDPKLSHLGDLSPLPPDFTSWTPAKIRAARQEYNLLADRIVAVCRIRPRLRRIVAVRTLFDRWLDSGDSIKVQMAKLHMQPSNLAMLVFSDGAAADRRATFICLALAAYKAAHGAFPAKLADIVPAFLKKIPGNPFNGKPFHYQVTGKGCRLSARYVYPPSVAGHLKMPPLLPLIVNMHR